MGRTEKASSIAELREKLATARGAVLTDFRGLNVAQITELRGLLRKSGAEFAVVKNTLAKIAIRDTPLAGLTPYFEGPTAIAVGRTDAVAPSKVFAAWRKTRPTFTVKGGVVEGHVVGPAEVLALGDLPPREVLLAQMLGALQFPLQGLVSVLAAQVRALASVLDQVSKKKEQAA